MTTEERLEKLEKELARGRRVNRCLLAALGVVLAGVVLAWAFAPGTAGAQGANAVAKEIRANAFILEDENGKSCAGLATMRGVPGLILSRDGMGSAMLAMTPDGPSLTLLAANGKTRTELTVFKEGPMLRLFDENGKLRAGLSLMKDMPGLAMVDENGKASVILVVTKNGPALTLTDENGKPRAGLTVSEDGPTLGLYDENSKSVWSAP